MKIPVNCRRNSERQTISNGVVMTTRRKRKRKRRWLKLTMKSKEGLILQTSAGVNFLGLLELAAAKSFLLVASFAWWFASWAACFASASRASRAAAKAASFCCFALSFSCTTASFFALVLAACKVAEGGEGVGCLMALALAPWGTYALRTAGPLPALLVLPDEEAAAVVYLFVLR